MFMLKTSPQPTNKIETTSRY